MAGNWERLAVRPGGTVASLAAATSADGSTTVLAATAAGMRRSDDAGRTWTAPRSTRQTPGIEVVAPSPNFAGDGTIFAGAPNGLYRSTDAGAGWSLVLGGNRVLAAAVSPAFAGDRMVLVGTESDGLLRSDDGGDTWSSANPGLLDLTVLAAAFSPAFESDKTAFAATAAGLYRSRNGAKSWRPVDLPAGEVEVQCLALSPRFAEDGLVLAGTVEHGLLRSTDGGGTWAAVSGLPSESVTALAFPDSGKSVAAATADGVFLSDDGGETWRAAGADLGPVLALAFVGDGGAPALLAGLPKRGVARLAAGGNWEPANEGLAGNLIVGLALSPGFGQDRTLFTASLEDGVAVSTDGGATWEARNDGLDDPAVFGLALSTTFANAPTLYAATAAGVFRSRDGAATWQPVLVEAEGVAARYVATGPGREVLAAFQDGRVSLSTDGGETWEPLAFDAGGAEVVGLAVSPGYAEDRTLFVAAGRPFMAGDPTQSDLALYRSTDGGARWGRWLETKGPNALPLAVPAAYNPRRAVVWVGAGQRVLQPSPDTFEIRRGERRPMWRSTYLVGEPASVTALALAPGDDPRPTIWAATGLGVHVSRDGGQTFAAWDDGLDPAPVVALAVTPAGAPDPAVYAVGLGGTLWRRTIDA